MNRKIIWLITLFILVSGTVKAQCNNSLVDKAARQAGTDAIYIRDFKVKLSQGTMDEPSPTGKFPVYLNKGVTYRFSVANAKEFKGRAIVEITRRDQIYAGNYDFTDKVYSKTFDFQCERSSSYQIQISYGDGSEGCSAVVMAMVLQDSMTYIEPGIPVKSDSAGTLYLYSNNRLQIASSAGKDAVLEVSISQGTIFQKWGYYIARPDSIGEALIKVVVKKDGKMVETDSVLYKVEYPELPRIELHGENDRILSLSRFNGEISVSLINIKEGGETPYTLKQFSIAPGNKQWDEIRSYGNQLSPKQVQLIQNLKPRDKFYILNALFIDPEGKIHRSSMSEVFVVE